MRMIRQIAVAAAVWAAVSASGASAQDRLTFKQAVDLVVKNNAQVAVAEENTVGASLKIAEAKSLYWPQVSLGGTYTRMSLFGEIQFPFNGQMTTIKFGTPNNYSFTAAVVEQVFNWGRTAKTIEANRVALDLAQDGLDMTRYQLSFQVVPFYYGIVFFREAIRVLDDAVGAFEKKAAIMDRRVAAGLASTFDRSLIDIQISAVKAQRVDFETNIAKFRSALNTMAGRDPAAPLEPEAGLGFDPVRADRDSLVRDALGGRLEFKQNLHQQGLNRASLELAKTADKPTLVFAFNYQFRNGFMPNIDTIRGNWTAGLQLNYPVFDGFRTRTQIAEAQSSLRSTELRKIDLERQVALEIENALSDLRALEQKIAIEKAKVGQTEETLRIAEERYAAGLLSATDLLDAQNAVENARLGVLQLVYNHTLAKYTLDRSCGRIL
jgi:outer membrane protein